MVDAMEKHLKQHFWNQPRPKQTLHDNKFMMWHDVVHNIWLEVPLHDPFRASIRQVLIIRSIEI